jgi:FMN-dependent NADH-azoreductase
VQTLDLAAEPPAHLDGAALAPRMGLPEAAWTEAQRRENEVTERLLTQFLAADVIVLGAPMYNFGAQPAQGLDRPHRAGRAHVPLHRKGPEDWPAARR